MWETCGEKGGGERRRERERGREGGREERKVNTNTRTHPLSLDCLKSVRVALLHILEDHVVYTARGGGKYKHTFNLHLESLQHNI